MEADWRPLAAMGETLENSYDEDVSLRVSEPPAENFECKFSSRVSPFR